MPDVSHPASMLKACSNTAAIVRNGGTCSKQVKQNKYTLPFYLSPASAQQCSHRYTDTPAVLRVAK